MTKHLSVTPSHQRRKDNTLNEEIQAHVYEATPLYDLNQCKIS